MPLEPLKFDTIINVRKSLARLRKRGLISIEVTRSHYKVKANEELADELVVSPNGNTYLFSDIFDLSEEEAADVKFARKNNNDRTVVDDILRNRPLAEVLNTLRFNGKAFSIKLKTSLLFPFPTVFPVITQDEKTEEMLKAVEYQQRCLENNIDNPYSIMLPNNALEQIYTYSSKSRKQLKDYKLGLFDIGNNQVFADRENRKNLYNKDLQEHPEFKNKNSVDEISYIRDKYEKKIKYRKIASITAICLLTTIVFVGLGLAAAVWLLPLISLAASLSLLASALAAISKLSSHWQNKIDEKNAVASSIIEYKNKNKNDNEVDSLASRLSIKKAVIDNESKQTALAPEQVADDKRPERNGVSAFFTRLFKPASKRRRVRKPVVEQNDVPPVFVPDHETRYFRYYMHR